MNRAGGTTDYAVEIFLDAMEENHYTCFLKENTYLPMMYMPDAIRATIELMESDADKISVRIICCAATRLTFITDQTRIS